MKKKKKSEINSSGFFFGGGDGGRGQGLWDRSPLTRNRSHTLSKDSANS